MKTAVYLAIPNYNMADQLERLVASALDAGYEHIYVLDDCSSDHSQEIVAQFESQGVSFIPSNVNKGAGATRNQILNYQSSGIIHFLDADVNLVSANGSADNIRAAFARHPDAGAIGFQVLNPDKTQYDWNFGPKRKLIDGLTWKSFKLYKQINSNRARLLLERVFKQRWDNFWTYTHPESGQHEQQVGAAVECNLAVRLEDFQKVDGFDGALRFHEIHSLALRLRSIAKTIWYVPEVAIIKHDEVEVRANRKQEMRRALWLLDFKRLTGQYKIR